MNTDNYPEGGFLDHMVVLCVIFWKTSILFSTVAVLLCITTNSIQGLQFLHIIANTCCHLFFVFLFFFDDGHPDRHEWHLTAVSTCLFLQIKWNVSDFKYFFFPWETEGTGMPFTELDKWENYRFGREIENLILCCAMLSCSVVSNSLRSHGL